MQYYFILGTNCALSLAELFAVLDIRDARLLAPDFLLAQTDDFDPDTLIRRLGGVIKIGKVESILKSSNQVKLLQEISELALNKQAQGSTGKFNFGISGYGSSLFNEKILGLKLKQVFKEKEISCRFVVSQEKTLSSVVVSQNKLLSRGIEIILVSDKGQTIIGQTLAVQPFKDMSLRDYGRPARDDHSGMLPPKLAQIMINLASKKVPEAVLLDPFCGSGTVLTEAFMMGYQKIFGSDISVQALEATRRNVGWVKELYKISAPNPVLSVCPVQRLSSFIKPTSIDAIVTEPYLGPQRGKMDIPSVISELEELYSLAFKEFFPALRPQGRVVMVWPVFYGERPINPQHTGFKVIDIIPGSLKGPLVKLSRRGTIIYGRPGQKVFREIVVLEKE